MKSVSVYIAAMYSWKEKIRKIAAELRKDDVEVTSSWIEEPHDPLSNLHDIGKDNNLTYAKADIRDIDRADYFLMFSLKPTMPFVRGGRHFETGYAYAKGKPVIIVGPKENIFHYLEDVIVFKTWKEAKAYLIGQPKTKKVA